MANLQEKRSTDEVNPLQNHHEQAASMSAVSADRQQRNSLHTPKNNLKNWHQKNGTVNTSHNSNNGNKSNAHDGLVIMMGYRANVCGY